MPSPRGRSRNVLFIAFLSISLTLIFFYFIYLIYDTIRPRTVPSLVESPDLIVNKAREREILQMLSAIERTPTTNPAMYIEAQIIPRHVKRNNTIILRLTHHNESDNIIQWNMFSPKHYFMVLEYNEKVVEIYPQMTIIDGISGIYHNPPHHSISWDETLRATFPPGEYIIRGVLATSAGNLVFEDKFAIDKE